MSFFVANCGWAVPGCLGSLLEFSSFKDCNRNCKPRKPFPSNTQLFVWVFHHISRSEATKLEQLLYLEMGMVLMLGPWPCLLQTSPCDMEALGASILNLPHLSLAYPNGGSHERLVQTTGSSCVCGPSRCSGLKQGVGCGRSRLSSQFPLQAPGRPTEPPRTCFLV